MGVEFSRKEFFVKNSLSLHAISWESVITEPSIFNWSGNNFEDLCVLFCTDLICCHNNFVSLLSATDAVKWLLFALLIRDFVKFLYFLYSAQFRRFFIHISKPACLCNVRIIPWGHSLGFNPLRFNRRMLV